MRKLGEVHIKEWIGNKSFQVNLSPSEAQCLANGLGTLLEDISCITCVQSGEQVCDGGGAEEQRVFGDITL